MTRVTCHLWRIDMVHNRRVGGRALGRPVQVIAHRGASLQCPENTVAAFRCAAVLGADAAELDVRRTRDGVLVVHHDPVLPQGAVVAHVAHAALPAHIPTLTEALDACAGMWVNVEVKNDPSEPDFDVSESIAEATAQLLTARSDPAERWLVSSFSRATIDVVHAVAPHVPTAWLCLEVADGVPGELAAAGHVAVHPWVVALTPRHIEACHEAGLVVNTWTLDDPVRMAELIAVGLDGICTNAPDVARQVVDASQRGDEGNTNRTASGT
jgi:glycerophosphoryl diester phosphodiesterase